MCFYYLRSKEKKAFSVTRAQACLLAEVIKLTLAFLTERWFIIKVVQRITGRAQTKARITLKMIPSPKLILFVCLMRIIWPVLFSALILVPRAVPDS